MNNSKKLQASKYMAVGRQLFWLNPEMAHALLKLSERKPFLTDNNDIRLITMAFREYFGMEFPTGLKKLPTRASTYMRIKFTSVAMFCYCPEAMDENYPFSVKRSLRMLISREISTNPTHVSHFISKARFYMNTYPDFNTDVSNIVGLIKTKTITVNQ